MQPKTTKQNLLYWSGALMAALLISFLNALIQNWPPGGSVDLRGVIMAIAGDLLTLLPIVLAGLGLPTLGKERQNTLVSEIGTQTLEQIQQPPVNLSALAQAILDEKERREARG